jgi:hypothetical protein
MKPKDFLTPSLEEPRQTTPKKEFSRKPFTPSLICANHLSPKALQVKGKKFYPSFTLQQKAKIPEKQGNVKKSICFIQAKYQGFKYTITIPFTVQTTNSLNKC